jgi:hypothetical protein
LLGDGDKLIEIVYDEAKNYLNWADQRNQGRTKISFFWHKDPNEPTNFNSQQGPELSGLSAVNNNLNMLLIKLLFK